jgi:hypothetical protein
MRRFQRRRVIDAITGHGDDLAISFEGIDDAQLLLGHCASEDRRRSHAFCKIGIPHAFELGTGEAPCCTDQLG